MEKKKKNKKNPRQIAALIGIALLILLYVGLLIQALTFGPDAGQIFMSALTGTVTIPIVVWLFIWVYGVYPGIRSYLPYCRYKLRGQAFEAWEKRRFFNLN